MCFSVAEEKKRSQLIEKELKAKKKMVCQRVHLFLHQAREESVIAGYWKQWQGKRRIRRSHLQSTFCKQLTSEFGGSNPHFQSSNDEVVSSLKENVLDGMKRLLEETAAQANADQTKVP